MARHTKKHNKLFEDMAIREISKVLGEPKPWLEKDLEWSMPYGTGTVTLHLIRESMDKSKPVLGSWLACRIRNDAHLNSNGYTLPKDQIPGGWNNYFTYPSGKSNLHLSPDDDEDQMLRDLALHLYRISEPDSEYKQKFGQIDFEPDLPSPGM